jgi:dTMP kinase
MKVNHNQNCIQPGLIALEGIDGSGKSTQARLLLESLERQNLPVAYISFPRTAERGYGEAIAMFLRGEFGSVEQVHPYLIASLFAGDRAAAGPSIGEWLKEGKLIVADRYFYSNLAFQAAKISDELSKERFAAWLRHIEFECNHIPEPDLTIFFDVPFEFAKQTINARMGGRRPYLNGVDDIHETSLHLQYKVAEEYRRFGTRDSRFRIIHCKDASGRMRDVDGIQNEFRDLLSSCGVLPTSHIQCR